jgi:hypothetical protein
MVSMYLAFPASASGVAAADFPPFSCRAGIFPPEDGRRQGRIAHEGTSARARVMKGQGAEPRSWSE